MGKRKSKKKVMKKKKEVVATVYDCPFCNHRKVVECSMNRKLNLGTLKCRICGVTYQMPINHLTHPIDLFSEWVDECAQVNDPLNQMDDMNSDTHMLENPDELERALGMEDYGNEIYGEMIDERVNDDINRMQQTVNYQNRSSSPLSMTHAVASVANHSEDFGLGERELTPLHS